MGNIAFSRGYELANWNKIVARRDKRLTTEKKGAVGPNEPMHYFKLLPIHEREPERGNIRLRGNKLI